MPEVDFTTAWMALKASIVEGQRSRGQDELLATMARVEVENTIPDDQQGFDDRPGRRSTTEATTDSAAPGPLVGHAH